MATLTTNDITSVGGLPTKTTYAANDSFLVWDSENERHVKMTKAKLEETYTALVTQAQNAASAADGSATAASGSATAASGSASAASGSASAASASETNAHASEVNAAASDEKAEGFAVGQNNGSDVPSTSPYYENNAKYYKLQAEGFAVGKQDGTRVVSPSPFFENNAEYFKDQAEAAEQRTASMLSTKQDVLTFDTTPTSGSTNPVTSGGVYSALANLGGYKVVPSLASVTNPDEKTIYLVKDSSATGDDKYEEYIWQVEQGVGSWQKIGDTSLDLSDYIKNTDLATNNTAGIVRPDGSTITVDANGIISGASLLTFDQDDFSNDQGDVSLLPARRIWKGTKEAWELLSAAEKKEYGFAAFEGDSLDAQGSAYAVCATAAGTAAKTVTVDDFALSSGVKVQVKFTNGHTLTATKDANGVVTADYPTLNVSSTGAKAIKVGAEYAGENFVTAGDTHEFIYDGTYWVDLTAVNIYENSSTARKRDGKSAYRSTTSIPLGKDEWLREDAFLTGTSQTDGVIIAHIGWTDNGYTARLYLNNNIVDFCSNYTEGISACSLRAFVRKGDTWKIDSDAGPNNNKIVLNRLILQPYQY